MSFQISTFSACYKQLNVLHLKHPCLILFPCIPVPAASCADGTMRSAPLRTGMLDIREMAVWFSSDTATHETGCCQAPFLPVPGPSPVFHSVLITLHDQNHILGQIHKGASTQVQLQLKCFLKIVSVKEETRRRTYLWFQWKDIISQKSNFQLISPM